MIPLCIDAHNGHLTHASILTEYKIEWLASCKCTPQHVIMWYVYAHIFSSSTQDKVLKARKNIYDVTCLQIWESLKGCNQNLEIMFVGGMWSMLGSV